MSKLIEEEERLRCKGGGLRRISVREASALTIAYVTSEAIYIEGADNIGMLVSFTLGSSDGCRIKIEFSYDEVNWYQEPNYTVSGSDEIYKPITKKLESSMNIQIDFPVANRYMRISVAAITSGSGTSLTIVAVLANL